MTSEDGIYRATLAATEVDQGRFLIKEIQAPAGYTGSFTTQIDGYEKSSWTFTLDDGNPAYNSSGNVLEIIKYETDSEEKLLNGARFTLTNEETGEVQHLTTGRGGQPEGRVLIRNLEPGSYTLTESAAPFGYIRDTERCAITVDANGLINLKQHLTLSIPNERFFRMTLYTGGVGRILLRLAGLLVLALCGLAVLRGRLPRKPARRKRGMKSLRSTQQQHSATSAVDTHNDNRGDIQISHKQLPKGSIT